MNSSSALFVTVVIRSYNRLHAMIELVNICQNQTYNHFEILVIEQSDAELRKQFHVELEKLTTDDRVSILHFGRLGPAGARNMAVKHAKGDVLLFVDDDDIPESEEWIKNHVKNFDDPKCVAVTGREYVEGEEDPSQHNTTKNIRLCLRYSFFKMPRARTKHTKRIKGVTALQGGNTAIRKEVIERVGGWDEDVECHEENSFDFKFHANRKPGEYYVYEPDAPMKRRLDIEGGLGRRQATTNAILKGEHLYCFKIIKRYFPLRFYSFFCVYTFLVLQRTYDYMRKNRPEIKRTQLLKETLSAFFVHVFRSDSPTS